MQAKLSRQEEKQALAELKAHKVALASMERRVSAALSRKDPCALAWLSVLRESFAHGTALEVRERNLQAIYGCLYKLDPKAPIPACCLRSAKDLEEEERSLTVRSASSELNRLVSQLQVEYHELTAPLVAMKPNVYFLCTCHLGRPMEMGRIYVDKQSNLPPVLGDVPWVLVCMWALLIGSAVNSVVQRMGAGKSQTAAVAAASSPQPAKGPRGTVPAALTTFKAAPGGIREYDGQPVGVAPGHGQSSRKESDWWDDLDGAMPDDAPRWTALERHATGQEQEPDAQAAADAEVFRQNMATGSTPETLPAVEQLVDDEVCDDRSTLLDEAAVDADTHGQNMAADGTPEVPSVVEQVVSEEATTGAAEDVAEEVPGDRTFSSAEALLVEATAVSEAHGQQRAVGSVPEPRLAVERVVDDDEASKAEAALQSGRSEGPSQAAQRQPLLRKSIPEDWIERLASERKAAIAVASAWSPGTSLLRRREIISSISLVAVGSEPIAAT